jgi:hypothetical protein
MAKVSARGATKVAVWREEYTPLPSSFGDGDRIVGKEFLLRSDGAVLYKHIWSGGTKEGWKVYHPKAVSPKRMADREGAAALVEAALLHHHAADPRMVKRIF